MVIDVTIISNLLAANAGIIPSHSCWTCVHFGCICSQIPRAMSKSNPDGDLSGDT